MALKREAYRELEDILGPENISEDLAVLNGYTRAAFSDAYTGKLFMDMPGAVVLPARVEEVQSIVKLCNRRRIKFKAFSTGYGPWALPGSEDTIILDLRRMNRIIEIDDRNMYIVVEPYVSSGQAQAEAMKRGLTCLQLPAGAQCSLLAAHTSMDGRATQSLTVGHASRNLLGVEWISPTGEVIRLGSVGSGAGWFSGDGPGPSLRGILRGNLGAMGGLGVFTKCAVKLYPWPGPAVMETKGILPDYELEVPPLFEYRLVHFPGWREFADAAYKICESRIAYAMEKVGSSCRGSIATTSNDEYWERLQTGELEIPRVCLGILLAADSPKEHEYQVKVLNNILDETGGASIHLAENPTFLKRDYLELTRPTHKGRDAFRPTGASLDIALSTQDTIDDAVRVAKVYEEAIDKLLENHQFAADTDSCRLGFYEQGLYAYWESSLHYDPTNQQSIEAATKAVEFGFGTVIKERFCPLLVGGAAAQILGSMLGNLHIWLRKIKRAFDPNNVSDPSWYISAEEE
jgi:glycolate oxidase